MRRVEKGADEPLEHGLMTDEERVPVVGGELTNQLLRKAGIAELGTDFKRTPRCGRPENLADELGGLASADERTCEHATRRCNAPRARLLRGSREQRASKLGRDVQDLLPADRGEGPVEVEA